jgi:hypothetical protein
MQLPTIVATITLALAAWLSLAVIVALPLGAVIRRRNAEKPTPIDFDAMAREFFDSQNASPRA